MSVLTSFAEVDLERSWESLARREGCEETWTLEGRGAMFCGFGGQLIFRRGPKTSSGGWYEYNG